MANAAVKNRLKSNRTRLIQLSILIAFSNLVFLISRLTFNKNTPTQPHWHYLLIIYVTLTAIPLLFMVYLSLPTYSSDGTLVSGGDDITSGLIAEYSHDIVYIAVLAQMINSFWKYGHWFLLIIPTGVVAIGASYATSLWSSKPKVPVSFISFQTVVLYLSHHSVLINLYLCFGFYI